MNKSLVITILILFIPFFCLSQDYYGGSASVKVKDSGGNTRTINVTTGCYNKNSSDAKTNLLALLVQENNYSDNLQTKYLLSALKQGIDFSFSIHLEVELLYIQIINTITIFQK